MLPKVSLCTKGSRKEVRLSDLVFEYEKEISHFLKCCALLRTATRLCASFPKGNHRATKALLVFSGLQPTDHGTWGVNNGVEVDCSLLAGDSDKEFMTAPFEFNVYSCTSGADFAAAVSLLRKYSVQDAKKIGALSSLTITDLHM